MILLKLPRILLEYQKHANDLLYYSLAIANALMGSENLLPLACLPDIIDFLDPKLGDAYSDLPNSKAFPHMES